MVLMLSVGCDQVDSRLMGEWRTNSEFYSAKYRIHVENDSVRGEVLYYNDGTTMFESSESDRKFIFKHLTQEENKYVDAVSGATKTARGSEPQMWSISVVHDDTLAIGQKIGKQTRTEIWTRIKE